MSRPTLKPLVAVIGATGTGKSELAVELARKYNGEIINGDAMQLYHGLPIITNKIPKDEMKGIPHHLLGCIGLEEETWTVGKFVERALGVIEDIRSRGKLPILVGGTHYYTQSLLFQDLLADVPLKAENGKANVDLSILEEPTDVIMLKLKEVDPVMAERWHPNERRKIQRSLEIYLKTGKPASQIYDEQRMKRDVPHDEDTGATERPNAGLSLRFPTLLFWVHASKESLHARLDSRILKMLDRGLLSEVETLADFRSSREASSGQALDMTRGIWVSIGYKEFLEYHSALKEGSVSEKEFQKLKQAAIEKTQAATRQYANRQIRWIRIKLLNALSSAGRKDNVFLLDGTDLTHWEDCVLNPAIEVTGQFLEGNELPSPIQMSDAAREMLTPKRDYDLAQRPDLWQKKTCETCGTVAVTENEWGMHVKSRGHRRAVGVRKKLEGKAMQRKVGEVSLVEEVADVLENYLGALPDEGEGRK
ncbi:tRNA isopentenyltransferase [Delitschia confertaspora ATCC 74209]|uniref:tRNA dimethylallyltransferase n=1 Tax=Delitschia confertaspora ATCC 74209 TaxID=1513339 RepID=A0A9P4MRQ7_9PLEO|nr:tRNA isopentenyltransferase [Delitschia confertaspora ATCC 74209]